MDELQVKIEIIREKGKIVTNVTTKGDAMAVFGAVKYAMINLQRIEASLLEEYIDHLNNSGKPETSTQDAVLWECQICKKIFTCKPEVGCPSCGEYIIKEIGNQKAVENETT